MKHLAYLKKNSLYFIMALMLGVIMKFSMSYFSTAVEAYTESFIISYANDVIDEGVGKGVIEILDGQSVLKESYDSDGKVSFAYLDTKTINTLRNNISIYITDCIEIINNGKDFQSIELPLGYFFGRNYFLSDGVKVPINLEVVGHHTVDIEKSVESYGINTTIIQINLLVTISIKSVIPFQTKTYSLKSSIPVALQILNNDIPFFIGS